MPRAMASTRRAYRPKRISNAAESLDCRRAITSSSLGERSPAALGAGAESSWLGLQAMGNVSARPCGGELMRSSQFRGITLHLQRDTPCTGAPPGQAPMLFETCTLAGPMLLFFAATHHFSFITELPLHWERNPL